MTGRHRRQPAGALTTASIKKPDPNVDREKVLVTLRPYSAAWWVVHDEMEAEEDKRLNAKMVICRTCFAAPDLEDHTGSVRQRPE